MVDGSNFTQGAICVSNLADFFVRHLAAAVLLTYYISATPATISISGVT